MISEARLHANQRNAQRSTGPRTEAGKLRSRCNALKHGLTGRGEVLGADEAAAVERRSAEWADALRPSGEHEHWLARQAVLASLRIDRCQELERARRGMDAARALACWEEDRQRAAEALGARLSRAPAVVAAELRRSRQGCNWLLVRWRKLEDTLDVLGRWDDAHRSLALDLLGEPAEAREADLEHLSSAPPDELRAIVASEITALEDLKAEAMDDLDAAERALAEAGLPVEEGAEVRRLRHYESACWRALRWARQQLRSASPREPGPTTVPGPEDDEPEGDAVALDDIRPVTVVAAPAPLPLPAAAPPRPLAPEGSPEGRPSTATTISSGPDRRYHDALPPGAPPPNRRARRALKNRARAR